MLAVSALFSMRAGKENSLTIFRGMKGTLRSRRALQAGLLASATACMVGVGTLSASASPQAEDRLQLSQSSSESTVSTLSPESTSTWEVVVGIDDSAPSSALVDTQIAYESEFSGDIRVSGIGDEVFSVGTEESSSRAGCIVMDPGEQQTVVIDVTPDGDLGFEESMSMIFAASAEGVVGNSKSAAASAGASSGDCPDVETDASSSESSEVPVGAPDWVDTPDPSRNGAQGTRNDSSAKGSDESAERPQPTSASPGKSPSAPGDDDTGSPVSIDSEFIDVDSPHLIVGVVAFILIIGVPLIVAGSKKEGGGKD